MKRLAKLEPIAAVIEERVAPFTLPSPARALAPPLLPLEAATVGYDGAPVLRDLNLRLDVDDRIGLLGVNGAGKSTFAKMVAGALALQSGQMKRDNRIQVGWFHQHQIEALDPTDTPLDIIRRARPDDSESARRSRLAQFGLSLRQAGDHGRQPLRRRARAAAAQPGRHGGAASADPRRADQPSRHRQPPRAARRAQRLRGRRDPDHPRPLADRAGGGPAVARRRRPHQAVRRRHGRLRPLRARPRPGRPAGPRAGRRSQGIATIAKIAASFGRSGRCGRNRRDTPERAAPCNPAARRDVLLRIKNSNPVPAARGPWPSRIEAAWQVPPKALWRRACSSASRFPGRCAPWCGRGNRASPSWAPWWGRWRVWWSPP